MLFAANVAIVFLGGFEELVAAVSGFASDLFPNALHFVRREGLEVAGDLKILLEDQGLVAAVGADHCHQEHAVTDTLEAGAHPLFALSAVIFPAVIEDRDAAIHGLAYEPDGRA